MFRYRTIVAILGTALIYIAMPTPGPAAATSAAPPTCTAAVEMQRTLAQLGENPASWEQRKLAPNIGGNIDLDSGRGYVNTATPCELVGDVVRHEWMHLQQLRMHGGSWEAAAQYYGSYVELVADCGSMLLGSAYTPNVRAAAAERGRGRSGCSPYDLGDAHALIAWPPPAASLSTER